MGQGIEDTLKRYKIVGLDTNCFIYLFEKHEVYLSLVRPVFKAIEVGQLKAVTSVITVMEILVQPKKQGHEDAVEAYKYFLQGNPNLILKAIDVEVAELAAALRARYRLKPPDALQVAASVAEKAEAFVTNDRRIKSFPGLDILALDDFL